MDSISTNLWVLNIIEIYNESLVLRSKNKYGLTLYTWHFYYKKFRQENTTFYHMSSACYDLLIPLKNISLNN